MNSTNSLRFVNGFLGLRPRYFKIFAIIICYKSLFWKYYKGNKIKITTVNLENEKKIYKGILADIIEKSILLDQNKNLISIELDKISDAKLLV